MSLTGYAFLATIVGASVMMLIRDFRLQQARDELDAETLMKLNPEFLKKKL